MNLKESISTAIWESTRFVAVYFCLFIFSRGSAIASILTRFSAHRLGKLFVQYIKIVVIEVLATCLRFMINFLNIAFSFSRIALIGMNHNKLVKFMSEIGIKKYVAISLLFSSILSVIKYFSYKINYGLVNITYPIHYDYESVLSMSLVEPIL